MPRGYKPKAGLPVGRGRKVVDDDLLVETLLVAEAEGHDLAELLQVAAAGQAHSARAQQAARAASGRKAAGKGGLMSPRSAQERLSAKVKAAKAARGSPERSAREAFGRKLHELVAGVRQRDGEEAARRFMAECLATALGWGQAAELLPGDEWVGALAAPRSRADAGE